MAISGKKKRLGEILIDAGLITEDQLNVGLVKQKQTREPIGEILVNLGIVTENQIKHALELQYGIKAFHANQKVPPEVLRLVPEAMIRQHQIMPVAINQLTVAMVDPGNILALDDLRLRYRGVSLQPVVITEADFRELMKAIPRDRGPSSDAAPAEELTVPPAATEESTANQLIQAILANAMRKRATEILLEPQEQETTVRFRVDGRFIKEPSVPPRLAELVLARLRVMAQLATGAGPGPQTGVIPVKSEGRSLRLLMRTLPLRHGLMASLRIFDQQTLEKATPETLVMHPTALEALDRLLSRASGMILFLGPRHAGRGALLNACMRRLTASGTSVLSLEDPVLVDIPGVAQLPITEGGPSALRHAVDSALQQVSDAVVVQDLDDAEAASRLIRTALAGRLVLASFATTQPYLADPLDTWGVPARSLAAGVAGLVTCRLLRRLCQTCHGKGSEAAGAPCADCGQTGYRGLVGAYEVLPLNARLRDLLLAGDTDAIAQEARATGLVPLADYGAWLVTEGQTSPEEVARLV